MTIDPAFRALALSRLPSGLRDPVMVHLMARKIEDRLSEEEREAVRAAYRAARGEDQDDTT